MVHDRDPVVVTEAVGHIDHGGAAAGTDVRKERIHRKDR